MEEVKAKEIIKNGEKKISKEIKEIERKIPIKEKRKIAPTIDDLNTDMSSLYEMATKDEKTGLYNMRFFNTIFEIEIEKAGRYGKDLSLMMLDVDNFKQTNDNYGHKKGDDLLVEITEIIKRNIRKGDVPARFGGEEFIILLPNTDLRKALKIAERLRKNIILDAELAKIGITISVGISHFEAADNIASLFDKVDKALLVAKKEGKNKSILLSEMDINDLDRLASGIKKD